jgi:hypothetical protein
MLRIFVLFPTAPVAIAAASLGVIAVTNVAMLGQLKRIREASPTVVSVRRSRRTAEEATTE